MQFYTNEGKSKNADANTIRNIGLKNLVLFWVGGKALGMPESIRYLLEESLCTKVWRERKQNHVEMLTAFFFIMSKMSRMSVGFRIFDSLGTSL